MKKILLIMVSCLVLVGCGGTENTLETKSDNKEVIITEKEMTSYAYNVSEYLVYSCDMYYDGLITKEEFYERLIQIDTSLIDYQGRKEFKNGNFEVVYLHGGILLGCLENQESAIIENRDKLAELIGFDKY